MPALLVEQSNGQRVCNCKRSPGFTSLEASNVPIPNIFFTKQPDPRALLNLFVLVFYANPGKVMDFLE